MNNQDCFWEKYREQEIRFYQRLELGLQKPNKRPGRPYRRHSSFQAGVSSQRDRLRFARRAFDLVLQRLPSCDKGDDVHEPVYFVTLISSDHVTMEDSSDIPLHSLRQWVSYHFRGFSYLGMIEPAYFVNIGVGPYTGSRLVSWHAHLLVWGCSKTELKPVICRLNERTERLFPGRLAALSKKVRPGELGKTLAYILKSPTNEYMARPALSDLHELDAPTYIGSSQSRCQVEKRLMSNANMVRLARIMRDIRLDELLIAGGEGKTLRKSILE